VNPNEVARGPVEEGAVRDLTAGRLALEPLYGQRATKR